MNASTGNGGLPAHLHWGAEALWRELSPLLPGLSVEVVARTDSTNTQLIERARGGQSGPHGRRQDDTQPCLLVAEHQTHGRGRHGRTWLSSAGASLTFSLAVELANTDWSGLSLVVGVALAEALEPSPDGPPRVGLKWPNDLWLRDGRKIGGVLIETVGVGERRLAVIGVGLNVLAPPEAGGAVLAGAAAVCEFWPEADAPAVLHRVARPLAQALRDFERDGFPAFAERFAARDLLRGREVTTTSPHVPHGVAEGVGSDGALHLRVDGRLHVVASGEVSVRPAS